MSNITEDVKEIEDSSISEEAEGWESTDEQPEAEAVEETEEVEEESEATEEPEDETVEESESTEEEAEEVEAETETEPEVKKPTGQIPYDRFKAVNEEKKALAEKLKKYEQKPAESQTEDGMPVPPELTYDAEVDNKNRADYDKKLVEYAQTQALKAFKEDQAKQESDRRAQVQNEKIEAARKDDPEYDEILKSLENADDYEFIQENLSQPVFDAMQKLGVGFEKHILKNRYELLPKFKEMSESEAAFELGQLAASFTTKPTKAPPARKPTSKAKKPIKVSNGASQSDEAWPDGWN